MTVKKKILKDCFFIKDLTNELFRCEFTGSLIVVPDVSALNMPGAAAETGSRRGRDDKGEGLKGLKALGVRDLNYRMAFLACGVSADGKW